MNYPRSSAVSGSSYLQPFFIFLADATAIALRDPIPCPACRRLHCLFVNRRGATLCCDCDATPQEKPR